MDEADYTQLIEWLASHGAVIGPIEPHVFPETGRGVRATARIEPGTQLLSVPEALLLTGRSARRDPLLAAAVQRLRERHGTALTPVEELAAHLLHETSRGGGSRWAPYLRHLPASLTTLGCFPSDAACEALQVEEAVEVARAARTAAAESWERVRPLLADLGIGAPWDTRNAWAWALAGLSSRTMFLSREEPAGALTPLGDLHNYEAPPPPYVPDIPSLEGCAALGSNGPHYANGAAVREGGGGVGGNGSGGADGNPAGGCGDDEPSTSGDGKFDEEEQVYRLFARRSYAQGYQVFLCYGAHTNLELLEHYGFVLPPPLNPHDLAVLPLECLPPGMADALPSPADRAVHANGLPTWNLLKELRLAALSQAQRKASGYLAACGERVSEANDAAALRLLRSACCAALGALPTTLQEDEALLAKLRASGAAAIAAAEAPALERAAATNICDAEGGIGEGGEGGELLLLRIEPPSEREAALLAVEWRTHYKRALHASLRLRLEGHSK